MWAGAWSPAAPRRGQRGPDRTPEIEPPAAPEPPPGGQPGGQPAGQRVDLAAQLDEVVARGPQEVDLVGERLDGALGDRFDARVLGEPAADLALDRFLEGLDPLGDRLPGDLLGEPAAVLSPSIAASSDAISVSGDSARSTRR